MSVSKVECDNVKRGLQNTILTSAGGSGKLYEGGGIWSPH